jgi:hypothetical protein
LVEADVAGGKVFFFLQVIGASSILVASVASPYQRSTDKGGVVFAGGYEDCPHAKDQAVARTSSSSSSYTGGRLRRFHPCSLIEAVGGEGAVGAYIHERSSSWSGEGVVGAVRAGVDEIGGDDAAAEGDDVNRAAISVAVRIGCVRCHSRPWWAACGLGCFWAGCEGVAA